MASSTHMTARQRLHTLLPPIQLQHTLHSPIAQHVLCLPRPQPTLPTHLVALQDVHHRGVDAVKVCQHISQRSAAHIVDGGVPLQQEGGLGQAGHGSELVQCSANAAHMADGGMPSAAGQRGPGAGVGEAR